VVAGRLILHVMRARSHLLAVMPLALMLAGCSEAEAPDTVKVDIDKAGQATGTSDDDAARFLAEEGVTPNAQRVAVLGLLNKRNNNSQDIELRPGQSREIGNVIIKLASCERTAPQEFPQETGAFVQVSVLERGQSSHRRVFSGWLFKESPSRNVVEHPVYDVWVKECRMRFPGEPELAEPKSDDDKPAADKPAAEKPKPEPSAEPDT
jgi:hypothetical protein